MFKRYAIALIHNYNVYFDIAQTQRFYFSWISFQTFPMLSLIHLNIPLVCSDFQILWIQSRHCHSSSWQKWSPFNCLEICFVVLVMNNANIFLPTGNLSSSKNFFFCSGLSGSLHSSFCRRCIWNWEIGSRFCGCFRLLRISILYLEMMRP